MDTKLKNTMCNETKNAGEAEKISWLSRWGLKAAVTALSVIFITAGIMLLTLTIRDGMTSFEMSACIGEADYLKSEALRQDFLDAAASLRAKASENTTAEEIKEGSWMEGDLEEYKLSLLDEDENRYGLWQDELYEEDKSVIDVINSDAFLERHAAEIEGYKQDMINNKMSSYYDQISAISTLEDEFGLQWYIEAEGKTQTSGGGVTPENLKTHQVWGEIENEQLSGSIDANLNYSGAGANYETSGRPQIVFAFDDEKVQDKAAVYSEDHKRASGALQGFAFLTLAGLGLFVGACILAGRVPGQEAVALAPLDRVYWDLQLLICLAMMAVTLSGGIAALALKLPLALGVLLVAMTIALAEIFVLSLVRIIKAGKFADRCGIRVFCGKLSRYYHSVMAHRPLVYKVMALVLAAIVLGVLCLALPLV
ncbi:MAG: hypothetical protein Q4C55_10400, partial [Eubacterium sp.]|nr:hypothetical protein [Eubacterium sp.]